MTPDATLSPSISHTQLGNSVANRMALTGETAILGEPRDDTGRDKPAAHTMGARCFLTQRRVRVVDLAAVRADELPDAGLRGGSAVTH